MRRRLRRLLRLLGFQPRSRIYLSLDTVMSEPLMGESEFRDLCIAIADYECRRAWEDPNNPPVPYITKAITEAVARDMIFATHPKSGPYRYEWAVKADEDGAEFFLYSIDTDNRVGYFIDNPCTGDAMSIRVIYSGSPKRKTQIVQQIDAAGDAAWLAGASLPEEPSNG